MKQDSTEFDNKHLIMLALLIFAVGLFIAAYFIKNADKNNENEQVMTYISSNEQASAPSETPIPTPQKVTLLAVGDDLIHQTVTDAVKTEDGYDYCGIFSNVSEEIKNADLAVINQETIMAGEEFGIAGYFPEFNSPRELLFDLKETGFDVLTCANNHAMDRKEEGLLSCINFYKSVEGITFSGIYESKEDRNTPRIAEKNGIKIAFLSYTYGTNKPIPSGKGYLVPIISKSAINEDVKRAKDLTDVIIVSIHWGLDYSHDISSTQKDLAIYMNSIGVDIVLGHHPHVLQKAQKIIGDNGNVTFVAYSLGNFLSGQVKRDTLLGGMLKLTIEKISDGIIIKDESIIPIVTHYEAGVKNIKLYLLSQYTDELAKNHRANKSDNMISVKYYKDLAYGILGDYDASEH